MKGQSRNGRGCPTGLPMPETTQLNVRVSRVLAERIARVTSTTGVGRAEWVRARLVEAVDDAERRMLDLTAEHEVREKS